MAPVDHHKLPLARSHVDNQRDSGVLGAKATPLPLVPLDGSCRADWVLQGCVRIEGAGGCTGSRRAVKHQPLSDVLFPHSLRSHQQGHLRLSIWMCINSILGRTRRLHPLRSTQWSDFDVSRLQSLHSNFIIENEHRISRCSGTASKGQHRHHQYAFRSICRTLNILVIF
ncbi:hypothetical protein BU16DRAFT_138900 [Lophium mytilinum]|uniref:Uncharacterized protein n=1 Tax=Lophium mytilinum TaxID=390894 RepID=A0A6A6QEW4_9PEZI|nr:hypothetical protein BU16DRAFT_138900 [Lophium mytilinum]